MRSILLALIVLMMAGACRKNKDDGPLRYYQVGMKTNPADWRDSGFVVATNDPELIIKIQEELAKPVAQRKIVAGPILAGGGGYNRNATHEFNWRLDEKKWGFAEVTAEIMDGRPYSDVELNRDYFMDTVKGYGAWGSYIKAEVMIID